jgi:hypothetical protein
MITRQDVRNAYEDVIRDSAKSSSGDCYAATLWPDEDLELKMGTGSLSKSEAEEQKQDPTITDEDILDGVVEATLENDDDFWDELKTAAEASNLTVEW